MPNIATFTAKAKAIGTNLIAWLMLIAAIAGALVDDIPDTGLPPAVAWAATALATIATVALLAAAAIRRVTLVLDDQRGLLPTDEWDGTQTLAAAYHGKATPPRTPRR